MADFAIAEGTEAGVIDTESFALHVQPELDGHARVRDEHLVEPLRVACA